MAGVGALTAIGLERRRGGARRIAWGRGAQVTGLLLLAPICAEYLAAYDDSTGDPQQLIAGLFIFVPLYGCAALLIREVARRAQLGWPGIAVLALVGGAFSLAQRRPPARSSRTAPRLSITFGVALVAALAQAIAPETWLGAAIVVATFTVSVVTIAVVSRTTGWDARYIAAIAAAPLLVRAVSAFTYYPVIGEVSASAKYTHNAVLLALILAGVVLALRRPTSAPEGGRSCGVVAVKSPAESTSSSGSG